MLIIKIILKVCRNRTNKIADSAVFFDISNKNELVFRNGTTNLAHNFITLCRFIRNNRFTIFELKKE